MDRTFWACWGLAAALCGPFGQALAQVKEPAEGAATQTSKESASEKGQEGAPKKDKQSEGSKASEASVGDSKKEAKAAPKARPKVVKELAVDADMATPQTLAAQIKAAMAGRPISGASKLSAVAPSAPNAPKQERRRDPGKTLGKPIAKGAGASKPASFTTKTVASNFLASKPAAPWGYGAADGPARWASLDPSYALCDGGREQAPIHIETDKTLLGAADEVELRFGIAQGKMSAPHGALEAELASGQAWFGARGERYEVEAGWLSTPSTQRINFKGAPMGVLWLGRSSSGARALLAVDVEEGPPNGALDAMLRALPLSAKDKAGWAPGVDLSALIPPPGRRKHIQYMGSLPRPPCSEGVLWIVMRERVQASPEQIQTIAKLYPQTARPVQPAHGRRVREQQ
jgi:carbonic anhydrase